MRKRAGRKSRLEDRVMRSIRGRSGVVVLRSELTKLGGRSQLTKILAKLVTAEKLVRVGHGVYVKTRRNKFTGTMLPAAPLETVAAEAFRKLGIVVSPGTLAEEYNSGRTTQIPMMPVVRTGGRRISRRIQMGSKRVAYERDSGKGRS
ncbi:DUF6088 family protein [Paraburkholderia strydomiana]|uniref:DUF6088 family protein n=2 Tax=Paraburkholderia strydomiana TaxID=1245417 RepID=UPI0038BD9494